jgi:hypothetical protein
MKSKKWIAGTENNRIKQLKINHPEWNRHNKDKVE